MSGFRKFFGLAFLCLALWLAACTGQKIADSETGGSRFLKEDLPPVEALVRDQDSPALHRMLLTARITQTLVSAFDQNISRIGDPKQPLLESRLYRKLLDSKAAHQALEAKLEVAFRLASESGRGKWFLDEIRAFGRRDVAAQAASGHLLRHLLYFAETSCSSCAFPVEANEVWLDEEKFAVFLRKNQRTIGRLAGVGAADLAPDDSFGQGAKREENTSGYEWNFFQVNKPGQFLFTYNGFSPEIDELMKGKAAFFPLASFENSGPVRGLRPARGGDLGNLNSVRAKKDLNLHNRIAYQRELETVSYEGFKEWQERTLDREISSAKGRVTFFRLPVSSGLYQNEIGRRLKLAQLRLVQWDIDALDWQDKSALSVHRRVLAQMNALKRGVVVFEGAGPHALKSSRMLQETMAASGWEYIELE